MNYYYGANGYNNADAYPCSQSVQYARTPFYACPYAPWRTINIPDSWSFGPLKIEWSFNGESINLVVRILENAVREALLTLSKPTLSFKVDLGNVDGELTINADFIANQVAVNGKLCFDTICTTFDNTVIARW